LIALATGLRVYLAYGFTDMRKGMVGLSMVVESQEDTDERVLFA